MKYPNLHALSQGCISGRISEWPVLRAEAKEVRRELAHLHKLIEESGNSSLIFRARSLEHEKLFQEEMGKLND